MWARVKKSKIIPRPAKSVGSRLANSRGQAFVEYVLVLIIAVSLVLMLSNYFFKPFGEFVSDYMGKYTACLLQYGELPTLGSEIPSSVDEEGECNARFKAATIAQGRPEKDGNGSQTTKTTSTKSPDKDSKSRQSQGGSNSGPSVSIAGQGSRGAETGSSRGASGKVVEIALDSGSDGRFFNSNRSSAGSLRRPDKTSYVPILGLSEADRKNLDRKEGRSRITAENSIKRPTKKLLVQKPPTRMPAEAEETLWTIGNFIRFLFIAALIIALVVFIGGQALQMSKNFEK
jgi:hypothetical protein